MAVQIFLWFVAVQACGLAALPLALRLFRALPDGGYAFSKPLGLLLVTYLVWLLGMLQYVEYRAPTVLAVLGVLAATIWWRWGSEAVVWLRARRPVVALEEVVFLGVALIGGGVRAFNADIIGQEKFMDLAFFNGFLSTSDLPAEDAWLAGFGMPYYSFGYLLMSVPAKMAGLPGGYGYNLALVLVFALTILLSSTLASNLICLLGGRGETTWGPGPQAVALGLVSATFVAICGNLVGPLELLAAHGVGSPAFWQAVGVKNLRAAPAPGGWLPADGGWWWHASRVIPTIQPDGITEFPYFSFLLGDLHPHFISLPLLLLILGLVTTLLLEGRPWREPVLVGCVALALGAPIAANTWDAVTCWSLYALAALLLSARLARAGQVLELRSLAASLVPLPLGLVMFLPYFVDYASQPLSLAIVMDRTPALSLLIIFGPLLLLVGAFALRLLTVAERSVRGRGGFWLLGALATAGLWLLGLPTAALALGLLCPVLVAGAQAFRGWRRTEACEHLAATISLLAFSGVALAILAGAELVYIKDSFGTRMNTVFKFYYHVWLLLALVSGPAVALMLRRVGAPGVVAFRALAGLLLVGGLGLELVYPLAATWTKSNAFRGPATLDGLAFMDRSKPGDAAAIRWLAERPGRPVVLEAVGGDYEEFGRVSVFSGLPTVLGWVGHELQWRGQLSEYGRRQQDVDTLYRRIEPAEGMRVLNSYRVKYVFVGSLEREKYGPQVEERLARWLAPVFRRENVVVFAVPSESSLS